MSSTAAAAVRIEIYRREFGAAYHRLLTRYPALKQDQQNAVTWVLRLNRSSAWSEEDDAFFADLSKQGLIDSWERIVVGELPKRLTGLGYEVVGERLSQGKGLTLPQQKALWSERQDLHARVGQLANENQLLRRERDAADERLARLVPEYNGLNSLLAAYLRIEITAKSFIEETADPIWAARDLDTGRILARSTDANEVYAEVLQLRGIPAPSGSSR